jgi:hypothetical protein
MNGNDFAKQLLLDKAFRKSHEQKAFWRGRVKADNLDAIFSWSQLNACLSFNRITNDRFRLSANREHEVVNKRAFRAGKDGFGRTTDYLIINELHKLMREGATGVLEAVNELSASVSDLTERLGRELQAQSSANAYISFGDTSGFGVHNNDDHDVVVLQPDGCKKWQFFRSPVDRC